MRARRMVVSFFSRPRKVSRSAGLPPCSATVRALCTNMPPEPQAGSSTVPRSGSSTWAMSATSDTGVKNSPPSCAF